MKFSTKADDLKKALSTIILALPVSTEDTISSHTLIKIGAEAKLYATDNDKIAVAELPITESEGETSFTVDPKKLSALVKSSSSPVIKFDYDPDTATLNVYASEEEDSYISFASFNPIEFIDFHEELEALKAVKTVNASVLVTGLRFIDSFVKKDEKDKKFSSLYITKGAIYGSNGSNKIAAFQSPDLDGFEMICLRKSIIGSVIDMVNKDDVLEILINESEKHVVFSTTDKKHIFGFKKLVNKMPDLPIKLGIPDSTGFNIEKSAILKKLDRFSLTSVKDVGIKFVLTPDRLFLETLTERKSKEQVFCTYLTDFNATEFTIKCDSFKDTIKAFMASNVNVYIQPTVLTVHSQADIIEGQEKKPFTAVVIIKLPRII